MADENPTPERDESDQAAVGAPEEQESPEVGTSATDHFDEKFDPASLSDELRGEWKSMKGSLTRRQQADAEERRAFEADKQLVEALRDPDPERQAEALRRLGYETEGANDDEFEYQDEGDSLETIRRELDELKAERQRDMSAAEETELEEAEIAFINQGLEKLATKTGRDDLPQEAIQAIGDLSRVRRTPEGFPDVEGAYEALYTGVLPAERERWVNSKKSPQAPAGSTAVEVPDLDNARARQDYTAQRLQEIEEANPGN